MGGIIVGGIFEAGYTEAYPEVAPDASRKVILYVSCPLKLPPSSCRSDRKFREQGEDTRQSAPRTEYQVVPSHVLPSPVRVIRQRKRMSYWPLHVTERSAWMASLLSRLALLEEPDPPTTAPVAESFPDGGAN